MITFIIWLAILAVVIAAVYWFNVPAILMVVVAAVAATLRLHLKFVAAWWLLITTRR
ncbi:hypothetical protein OK351_17485 [Glutamicibacter sp. MNS18]|uniref:hypothetical protein n=1 Tax=Glutamicibacter sp. MNS18 TaxID=2989817 RepID=UPI0022364472|nr:hypothetical protein [Glutamicibacter sp. MNS18]MCW4467276.1 hypothetical protein [Glutamicibacter sp. MNS18]